MCTPFLTAETLIYYFEVFGNSVPRYENASEELGILQEYKKLNCVT